MVSCSRFAACAELMKENLLGRPSHFREPDNSCSHGDASHFLPQPGWNDSMEITER
jgi:hypothetical protein